MRFEVSGVSVRDVIMKCAYGAIFSSDRRLVGPLTRVRCIGWALFGCRRPRERVLVESSADVRS